MRQYGVHMNGYLLTDNGKFKMWIGRRSATKPTFPGLLDNMVINPRRACAARVTVVVLCVRLSVCQSVCPRLFSDYRLQGGL